MISNKPVYSIFNFNSIKNKYNGSLEPNLTLEVYDYGKDAVEVKLTNNNYQKQKSSLKKHFILLILSIHIYGTLTLFRNFHLIFYDILLLLWITSVTWRFWNLTEFEKFLLCSDFGIYLQIKRCLRKQSKFIRSCYIHDIVINEVLENLDFRYFLIIRTKDELFNQKPIVPIFKILKPSCECLNIVYKYLNK